MIQKHVSGRKERHATSSWSTVGFRRARRLARSRSLQRRRPVGLSPRSSARAVERALRGAGAGSPRRRPPGGGGADGGREAPDGSGANVELPPARPPLLLGDRRQRRSSLARHRRVLGRRSARGRSRPIAEHARKPRFIAAVRVDARTPSRWRLADHEPAPRCRGRDQRISVDDLDRPRLCRG